MNNNTLQTGVMVDYVNTLNFGQTVDIIDDSLYNEFGVRAHGDPFIIFVPKSSVQKTDEQFDYSNGPCIMNPRYEN